MAESPISRRTACCAFHGAAMWPSGMGAHGATPPPGPEPAPSFFDGTRAEPTNALAQGDRHTRDLYEVVGAGRTLVVAGGTVLPMDGSPARPDHDVLVRDGLIFGLQTSGGSLPDDAVRLDAAGKFVIPGLTDIHTHPILAPSAAIFGPMVAPEADPAELYLPYDLLMFLYLAAGVTRTEVMAGTVEELALREAIRAGRIRGPHMRVASPVIDGYPLFWSPAISWGLSDAEGGKTAARLVKERGFDFAKPYSGLTREAYTALAEECHRRGVFMMGHIPLAVGVEDAIAAGQQGVAHVFELFRNDPWERRCEPDLCARRARLLADHGVVVQSTLAVSVTFEYNTGYRPNEPRVSQFLDPMMNRIMSEESSFIQYWRNDPALVEQGRDSVKQSIEMTQALLAEGVTVIPGTDIPSPNLTQGFSVHEEYRMLVDDVGMSAEDVLRAATSVAAAYQGDTAAGIIAPGKRSDLVVLDRDPRSDIMATREIEAVVVGVALLRREAIARGVARAKNYYAAMPVPDPTAAPASAPA